MIAAKAAEYVDGWVVDKTRNAICAPEHVIGPSNPKPKPFPPGSMALVSISSARLAITSFTSVFAARRTPSSSTLVPVERIGDLKNVFSSEALSRVDRMRRS